MQQYLDLLQTIKEKGTYKPAAREGMPGTLSLFGYQFRHDLSKGFPLITTKKLSFKNIVVELSWFMKGYTNIKYLIDNGCNIWNEDAYNYYLKQIGKSPDGSYHLEPMSFEQFVDRIKNPQGESRIESLSYKLGDCGVQYGGLMRNLKVVDANGGMTYVDQLKDLIIGLRKNPESRRHIINNWNIGTLNDMALNACHALVQFNCRPLTWEEKLQWAMRQPNVEMENLAITEAAAGKDCPQYYLDCQLYQRSADVFLGVPYNIASYALLTEILARMLNMIPGEFVHTFGDVHIYGNHMEQVNEQLTREPHSLPKLEFSEWFKNSIEEKHWENDLDEWILSLKPTDFGVKDYNPHPAIKGKLSTGLQ